MANSTVTKLYSLKTVGYGDLHTQLQQISKDFDLIKKAKIAAEQGLNNATTTQQLSEYKKQLQDIKLAEAQLSLQAKQLEADMKVQQLQRRANIADIKDQTALDKALMAQQTAQAKAALSGITAQTGSYASLMVQVREFYALLKATPKTGTLDYKGQTFSYQEAITEFQRLSAEEQSFRRQFAADKTLVGEYTTGIVQAFKSMGLDGLITGQVTRATEQLKRIEQESITLKEALQTIGTQGAAGITELSNRLNAMAQASGTLDERFTALQAILQESGTTGASALGLIEQRLIADVNEANRLRTQLGVIQAELRGTGDVGDRITLGLANGFKNIKGQVAQFAIGYFGLFAAFNGVIGAIKQNEELSDSLVNLQIYIKGTKDETNELFESLKQIDTRTSLKGLVDIANTVAQKGVAKDQIKDVTQAFDEYFSVVGSAGKSEDVHEGVFTIAKLISIFNDDHEVTAKRVTELGNAIFALKTSGPVSNEFLQGYAERVGAVRSITGATIPQILGFGAAFQQLGQSEEVAGSATSILLTKLLSNVDKFATIAGVSVDKLRAIIKVNPFEGLLTVAQALKDKGAAGPEALVKLVGDLGVTAVRARGAFSELINNADLFRDKMAQANASIQDTGSLTDAFGQKQETLAGTLDKIGNAFLKAFSNPNFIAALNAISKGILSVVTALLSIPFSFVIASLTAATAAWLIYKGGLTITAIQQAANNEQTLLGYVRLNLMRSGLLGVAAAENARNIALARAAALQAAKVEALNAEIIAERTAILTLQQRTAVDAEEAAVIAAAIIGKEAHVVALEAEVVATEQATVATGELNAVTSASPLGAILTILLILVPAITAYAGSMGHAADSTKKLTDENNKAIQEARELGNEVTNLTKVILPLADRYDLLKSKTTLNKDEQTELDRIINQIAESIPGAITQFDKYGRAVEINTQKVRDYITTEQARLKVVNGAAIDEYNKKLKETNKALEDQQRVRDNITKTGQVAVQTFTADGNSGLRLRQASQEEIKIQQDKYAQLAEQKKGYEAEIARLSGKALDDAAAQIKNGPVPPVIPVTIDVDLPGLKAELDAANKAIKSFKGSQEDLAKLIAHRNELQAQYNALLEKTGKEHADKLSVQDRNDLNSSEAQKDAAIAQLELEFVARKKDHELTIDEQIEYLNRLKAINDQYNLKKIASIKGNNAAEKAERGKLNLQMVDDATTTQDKIKAIYQKAFEEQATLLHKKLDNTTATIKLNVDVVAENPDATNEAKALAEQQGHASLLKATNDYYTSLLSMAKFYGVKTDTIEEEKMKAIQDIQRQGLSDAENIIKAKLEDINVLYERSAASVADRFNNIRGNILSDKSRTDENKTAALVELDRVEQIAQATEKLKVAQRAYNDLVLQPVRADGKGAVSNDIAQQLHAKVVAAQQELTDAIKVIKPKIENLKDLFTNGFANLFKSTGAFNLSTEKGQKQYQVLGDTIKQTFDTAGNAVNSFFDLEASRLEESKKRQLSLLDTQETQAKARAQSQAEQNAIDKEFQAKKDAVNKDAFEKQKKQQIAQAEINLATQLSNLAVIAFSPNPLNILTLGTAGAIMYGIQAALAITNFGINVNKIKGAQFAYGGNPDLTTTKGGRVKGRSHANGGNPFQFKGRVFEDEVDELNVIRTKNVNRNQQYTVTGTQSQIASALNVAGGGVPFEHGAKIKRFDYGGGVTIQKYSQAPVFVPANQSTVVHNSGISKNDLDEIVNRMEGIAEAQSSRIDRLSVYLDTDKLDSANQKKMKQKQIRTL